MQTTASTTSHAIQESKGTQCIERGSKVTSTHYEEPEWEDFVVPAERSSATEEAERSSKTIVMLFTPPYDGFNDCDSIASVVEKGYRVLVTFDNTPILDRPYIDTLNSLVSHTGYAVVNVGDNSPVLRTYSNLPLMLLGGVKSITIVFELLSASSVAELRGKPSASRGDFVAPLRSAGTTSSSHSDSS